MHPAHRSIEPSMLDWMEHLICLDVDDPHAHASVWSYAHNTWRNNLLAQRGYRRIEHYSFAQRARFSMCLIQTFLPAMSSVP